MAKARDTSNSRRPASHPQEGQDQFRQDAALHTHEPGPLRVFFHISGTMLSVDRVSVALFARVTQVSTYEVAFQLTRVSSVQVELGVPRVCQIVHEGWSWCQPFDGALLFLGVGCGLRKVLGLSGEAGWNGASSAVECCSWRVSVGYWGGISVCHGEF